jgi:hypothetical protein
MTINDLFLGFICALLVIYLLIMVLDSYWARGATAKREDRQSRRDAHREEQNDREEERHVR